MSNPSGSGVRLAGAVVVALALAGCAPVSSAPPPSGRQGQATGAVEVPGLSRIAPGDRLVAPNLSGTTLAGSHLALDDLAGNVVVVNVWASWCAPCRTESPALASLDRKLGAQKVRFVGIDETDTTKDAERFVASVGSTYPQLVDPEGALLRQLPLLPQKGIPSTLILDRHHRMAARAIGAATGEQIATLVSDLLHEN